MSVNHIKTVTAVIVFILTIGGAIIAAEDRYVSDVEAAQTLKLFNQKMGYEIQQIKKDMLREEYDHVNSNYIKLKVLLFKYPEDVEISMEYQELKEQRNALKAALNGS